MTAQASDLTEPATHWLTALPLVRVAIANRRRYGSLALATLGHACAGSAPAPPAATPAAPIVEPTGADCLTHDKVEATLESLRASTAPQAALADLRLVAAACHKRVYVVGTARLIVWDVGDYLRGKASAVSHPLPTPACIERGLTLAVDVLPAADAIIKREIAQDPELWRDPDIGLVSWLECNGDVPQFETIATMVHETVHRVSRGACVFEFATKRDICFELDPELPPGTIAAYPTTPSGLDAADSRWFEHVQSLYLKRDGQGIRELLDEVTAYRIEAEMYGVGVKRKLHPKPGHTVTNNLPLIMALVTRYINELATRAPELAAKEFGMRGRNRDATLAVLDHAEASYRTWLHAVRVAPTFERTFWDDYQRGRQQWLARVR
jgi:hypothetical protein